MIATGNWGACKWTISDAGELRIAAGIAESVSGNGKYPWDEHREQIRSVTFEEKVTGVVSLVGAFMNCSALEEIDLSGLDTSKTVDMSWLLCGCGSLKKADLSMLDTGRVADMSCMFLSCRSLKEVIFGSIDTSSVMDMSRMFMCCSDLKGLDLSGLDNSALKMAEDMFFGCEGLRYLDPGKGFSLGGSGRIKIEMPEFSSAMQQESEAGEFSVSDSDWRTSRDGILYIADTPFTVRYDGCGAQLSVVTEADEGGAQMMPECQCSAGTQLRVERDLFLPPADRVFKEWNTFRDGTGRTLLPGQLMDVHSDMTLYAIWAGAPVFTEVYDIPEITYGQLLDLPEPQIDARNGEITSLRVEISNAAGYGWTAFENEAPLPVGRTGARIRYIAENFVGSAASESRSITIRPAECDMSGAHWVLPEDLTYDGTEKEVRLEGLPESVTAEYAGNTAYAVGDYKASVIFRYDEENYLPPAPVEDLHWSITKGRYHMSDLNWSYLEAFTYDGTAKSIRLEGLPEGTVPYYSGADAVNAGTYVATAGLDYDIDNYDSPDPVRPCTWRILKTTHDMSGVHWEGPDAFVYDGSPKKVEVSGLPEGVRAEYTGNVAVNAGRYTARAAFVLDDPVNYEVPDPVEFIWEIRKADHDMSQADWTECSLVYDGSEHSVSLNGIPEGVSVLYEGDTGTQAGVYTVRAEFCVEDLNNYNQMDPITRRWEIRKADIDISAMRWNYSSPYIYNGAEKSVELKNIPPEIEYVSYYGNSGIVAGSYTAHADFTYDESNYNPPICEDCVWTILKANLKVRDLHWNYEEPFTYDGREHEVHIIDLPDNALVTYENDSATATGTYVTTAHIRPVDPDNFNTTQPVKLTWEIRKAVFNIDGAFWDESRRVFDGDGKSISLMGLPEGVHVHYEGNEATEAGTYQAKAVFTIDDTDNFTPPDPMTISWDISPAAIDLSGICWDYSGPLTYDGSEKEILLQGLPEGVTARYSGNVASDAGEYTASAVLLPPEESNYRETEILGRVWRINKARIDVSDVHWSSLEDPVYDGMLKQVHLTGVPDNVRVEYKGNEAVEAGSYRAEAVLTPYDEDNYEPPKVSGFSWQINRADIDISGATWSGYETFVYDGTTHRVVLRDLPDLVEAVYEGNTAVDAGNYIALAEFRPRDQRNYNTPRRQQYEWSVAKAPINAEDIYWTSEGDDLVYNGEPHTLRLAGLPENVEAVCRGNTAVDAGEYIATAVLEPMNMGNYLTCALEPYRWEISKAEIDISDVMWASSGELVYDGTLKAVGLTGLADDVSVEYENNVAVDAGTYHASAVLSIENNNYTAPEIEGCTWTIEKAVPDISGITWNYTSEFTYDGYEKTVELVNVPEDMMVKCRGNAAIEAGVYVAEATLFMEDSMNYEAPEVEPLVWRIGKRDYDMSTAVWTGTEGLVYTGEALSVELTGLEAGLVPIYQNNVAVEAGVYTASARFLYDEDNYNPPPELTCRWEIHKAPLDTSGVRWNYDGPFKASGRTHTVTLQAEGPEQGVMGKMLGRSKDQKLLGLPEGTTVRYKGNTARAAGVYEAKAYLTIPPQRNHEVAGPVCLTWEITDEQ